MYLLVFSLLILLTQLTLAEIVPFNDWQYQRVALKDVSIHLRYHGTGPPVLLIHGYPEHSVRAFSSCATAYWWSPTRQI